MLRSVNAATLRPALLLAVSCAPGCARAEKPLGPAPLELARGFRPTPLEELVPGWNAGAVGPTFEVLSPFEWRCEQTLAADAFEPRQTPEGRCWFATLPEGAARYADRARTRLRLGGQEWARAPRFGFLPPGGFSIQEDGVLLRPKRSEPPAEAVLALTLSSGEETGGAWHVRMGDFSGLGLAVWSGTRERVALDLPERSRLSFGLRHGGCSTGAPATFRVLLGTELVFTGTLTAPDERAWRALELPRGARSGAELWFEVDGPPGLGCFVDPVVTHGELGDYRRRPWDDPRPDVVLFLADTFRADNLAACGGTGGDAPNLDRLADESVCFQEARSSASWTLPSLSALLTGCYPAQIGVKSSAYRMPAEIETLAERLAAAGYRTGAVTDAVYFSPTYGLNQGFGWFRARDFSAWSLDESIADARTFLAGDDGRPVLLVLHTYRAHDPYRTGREESDAAWRALRAETLGAPEHPRGPRKTIGLSKASEAHELYRAGVRALDECFASFRALLEEVGLLPGGWLLFTADHGEAFGENGVMQHGGDLWDSRLRVPLLIHGPGLAPRRVPWTVSNVDIAPTLAALLGLSPDPRWPGSTLLSADRDRSVFAFRLNSEQIAVIEGQRKLLAAGVGELEAGRPAQAFDVRADRGEEHNLRDEPWVEEFARRSAPRVKAWIESGLASGSAELDASEQRTLEELGYAGEK